MKKNISALLSSLWMILVLIGLVLTWHNNEITTDTYYMSMIGCGIWLMLLNIYNKE